MRSLMSIVLSLCTLMFTCNTSGGPSPPPSPPVLTAVSPNVIAAGSPDTTLNLSGSNFKSTARASIDPTEVKFLATKYLNSTQLQALLPAANIAKAATLPIYVMQTTGSNQSASKQLSITIAPAPVPTLTSISPAHVVLGSPAFTMTLTGTNFTGTSVAMWDSTALTTTFVSATQLTAAVPNTLYNFAGTSNITVKDTTGTSNSLPMTKVGVLAITTSSLPGGQINTPYPTTPLVATGGVGPYTWSITSGTLPAGLSLSTSGTISGTPTASGTSTFTVTVTDSTGTLAMREFTFGKQRSAGK